MKKLYFLLVLSFIVLSCNSKKEDKEADNMTTTASGLKYTTLKEGTGDEAKVGDEVLIHETMSYTNDSLLFDSRTLPQPVKVLIGGHQAIDGVDEGLRGMKKGEIRKMIVPPALSKRTNATFPHPDSTLVYEVEIVEILGSEN